LNNTLAQSDELHSSASGCSIELGLFVIWEKARYLQDRVLDDLASNFEICGVFEVHWTKAYVNSNFQRFYSDLEDVRGTHHHTNKGGGPLFVVKLRDHNPNSQN